MPSLFQLITFTTGLLSSAVVAQMTTCVGSPPSTVTTTVTATPTAVDVSWAKIVSVFPAENGGAQNFRRTNFFDNTGDSTDGLTFNLNNDARVARTASIYSSFRLPKAQTSEVSVAIGVLPQGTSWLLQFWGASNLDRRCSVTAAIFSSDDAINYTSAERVPLVSTNAQVLNGDYQKFFVQFAATGRYMHLVMKMTCNTAAYINLDDFTVFAA